MPNEPDPSRRVFERRRGVSSGSTPEWAFRPRDPAARGSSPRCHIAAVASDTRASRSRTIARPARSCPMEEQLRRIDFLERRRRRPTRASGCSPAPRSPGARRPRGSPRRSARSSPRSAPARPPRGQPPPRATGRRPVGQVARPARRAPCPASRARSARSNRCPIGPGTAVRVSMARASSSPPGVRLGPAAEPFWPLQGRRSPCGGRSCDVADPLEHRGRRHSRGRPRARPWWGARSEDRRR